MLKRNLLANYFGHGWRAVMSLAFVPIYIKYLGIEAYGLIGIFAILISALGLLDLGMKPALGREMARYTGGTHNEQSIWNLLRSIEIISSVIVIIVAFVIWFISNWLATSWVKAQTLPTPVVAQAFAIMGLVAALQFFESIYSSSLAGLQRQVIQNVIICSMATIRGLGAVGVLVWVSPTTQAFFIWQAICSCISLLVCAIVVYKLLPSPPNPARFSMPAMRGIGSFAGGMLGITFLSLLLVQGDKVILSKLLTLSEFGYYSLAATMGGALFLIVGPIGQAWFPKLTELQAGNKKAQLIEKYHQGAQLVSVFMGSAALIMMSFSETILQLWTHDAKLAHQSATLLSLLALGNLLNGMMWIPYQTQLAYGWTSLTIRMNIISITIIIPAFFVAIPLFRGEGAAWVWASLNAGYVLIGIHFMHRKILTTEKWKWYLQDIMQPLVFAISVATLLSWAMPADLTYNCKLAWLLTASTLTLLTTAFAAKDVRKILMSQIKHWSQF